MKDIFQEKFVNISNLLTASRILILPVFVYLCLVYQSNTSDTNALIWILSTIAFSISSDFLDGFLARKLNQETKMGQYLDPIADKLTSLIALGLLTFYFDFPLWIYLCIIARDAVGVWAGTYLFFKRGTQGKPNIWGKIGITITATLVIWYISLPWYKFHYPESTDWIIHPEYLAWILIGVLFFGIVEYKRRYWDLVFHPDKKL